MGTFYYRLMYNRSEITC